MPRSYSDLVTYLVQEGIIYFFFDDAADGYAIADLFDDE